MNFVIPSHMNYATHLSNMCSRPNTSCLNANFFTFFLFAKIKKKFCQILKTHKSANLRITFFSIHTIQNAKKISWRNCVLAGKHRFFLSGLLPSRCWLTHRAAPPCVCRPWTRRRFFLRSDGSTNGSTWNPEWRPQDRTGLRKILENFFKKMIFFCLRSDGSTTRSTWNGPEVHPLRCAHRTGSDRTGLRKILEKKF